MVIMYTTSELKEIRELLYKKDPDLEAPALDMLGARGADMTMDNVEVTWSEYSIGAGSQPDEAEAGTPSPTFNSKTRYSNVAQIFAHSTELTFSQLGNMQLSLSGYATQVGANVSGVLLPQDELSHQIDVCFNQIRRDMDYTFLRGVYVRPTDASASNRRTRGLISFVETFAPSQNVLDNGATGARALTRELVEEAELARREGGGGQGVIIAHPIQVQNLNDLYKAYAADLTWDPADRSTAGRNLRVIITPWGNPLTILPDRHMPTDMIALVDFAQCAQWIKPVPGFGGLFTWRVPTAKRTVCVETYTEAGYKYGLPSAHALIEDLLP